MPATRINPVSQNCIPIFQITRTYKILKSKIGIRTCYISCKNISSEREISFSVVKFFAGGGSGPPPPSSHIADEHTTIVNLFPDKKVPQWPDWSNLKPIKHFWTVFKQRLSRTSFQE